VADIFLEPRRRSPWPVVIAFAVLLALLIWAVMKGGGDRVAGTDSADTSALMLSTGETDTELPSAVAVFLRWSDARRMPNAMNPDHSHTATGIRNLAAALEALAAREADIDIENEVAIVRRQADSLWASVASTRHADFTRGAFVTLSGLMGALQDRLAPELRDEVANVQSAARSIRADEPLLDQRDRVQEFFERSATVVRQMSETSAR
jgi:hypothetical protein